MYIKFCRNLGNDVNDKFVDDLKAKLSDESNAKLSVELKEKPDLQVLGNVRLYRRVCLLLSVICLVLLFVIIILCVKFATQPAICLGEEVIEKEIKVKEVKETRFPPTEECSLQKCRALHPQTQLQQTQESHCHRCEKGWLHYESSCYFLSRTRLDWDKSREDCKTRGGDLAVITNQGVQNWLTTKGDLMYWIGLRYKARKWTWVNHTTLGESYWGSTTNQGDCGLLMGRALFNENWSSTICSYISPYICQKGV